LALTLSTFATKSFEANAQFQAIGSFVEVLVAIVAVPVRVVSDAVDLASREIAASVSSWNPKYVSTVFDVGIAR
jgi:hypothetical protein